MRYDGRERATFEILGRRADDDLNASKLVEDVDFEIYSARTYSSQSIERSSLILSPVWSTGRCQRKRSQLRCVSAVQNLVRRLSKPLRRYSGSGQFLASVDALTVSIDSFDQGIADYRSTWFQTDQLYRQFGYYARHAEYPGALKTLPQLVESFYSNKFLLPLGDAWQKQVDAKVADGGRWHTNATDGQASFFTRHVAPVIKGGRNKLCASSSRMRCATRSATSSRPVSAQKTVTTLSWVHCYPRFPVTRSWGWRRCCRTRPSRSGRKTPTRSLMGSRAGERKTDRHPALVGGQPSKPKRY